MLPEQVARLAGQAGEVTMMEMEKGAIKKFAHAIDDDNPLYLDEEYARNSSYGAIVAPPGFFGWPTKWAGAFPAFSPLFTAVVTALREAGFPGVLDGGIEYEFLQPVRAGDTLAVLPRITRLTERETKGSKLVFCVLETTYTNQTGALVATARQTIIVR